MLLSAVSVLVVAQSSSEIPEGLMNNPVFMCLFRKKIVMFMRLLVLAALARNCDFNLLLRLKKQLSIERVQFDV